MPKLGQGEDIHIQPTMILENGRRRNQPRPDAGSRKNGHPQPPPPPAQRKSSIKPLFDKDLHAAPTMIIDIGRMRRQKRS